MFLFIWFKMPRPTLPIFLNCLVAPLADKRVAAVYGRQLPRPPAGPVERFWPQHTYPDLPHTKSELSFALPQHSGHLFLNVCSAIRREVSWERVPFNEDLIMSEDQQWLKEVLRQGYAIVYEPAVTVLHSQNYLVRKVFQRNFDSWLFFAGGWSGLVSTHGPLRAWFPAGRHQAVSLSGNSSHIPYFFLT